MSRWARSASALMGAAICGVVGGCGGPPNPPGDNVVFELIRRTPPAPPMTFESAMVAIETLEVKARGRWNTEGCYWPLQVRVKGRCEVVALGFQMLMQLGKDKHPTYDIDYVQEVRLSKNDFDEWTVSYVRALPPGAPTPRQ